LFDRSIKVAPTYTPSEIEQRAWNRRAADSSAGGDVFGDQALRRVDGDACATTGASAWTGDIYRPARSAGQVPKRGRSSMAEYGVDPACKDCSHEMPIDSESADWNERVDSGMHSVQASRRKRVPDRGFRDTCGDQLPACHD
jgi:hypothetical protein